MNIAKGRDRHAGLDIRTGGVEDAHHVRFNVRIVPMHAELGGMFAFLHVACPVLVAKVVSGARHQEEVAGTLVAKAPSSGEPFRQHDVILRCASLKSGSELVSSRCIAQMELYL